MNRHPLAILLLTALVLAGLASSEAQAARLKDVASFSGVRTNQLVGYGLVVGLGGTGDKRGSDFTIQSIWNMLDKMGVRVDKKTLRPANVAAVMVTAQMPATAHPGTKLDVTVSSLGDASSLLGGVLLMTPMKGVDGEIYGLAQGPVAVGGFSASGAAASATKNVTTVATIPGGANVERSVPFDFNGQRDLTINLGYPDFTTAMAIVKKINQALGGGFARASDASTIKLEIPEQHKGNMVPLMATVENLEITPDNKARVVVDEKTGTVVVGLNVKLTRSAVTHGNLQITIQESAEVSQPLPFAPIGAETVAVPETTIGATEENRKLRMVEGATLQELVEGLNVLKATPRDLISILKTLRSAGALHADLEVI
ncbi:flagellar basal body P-ring protein FlgI [Fundidesulfovibrio putealis]|uniref:flagellar basal body P-ring protein FlgI n=1 Tax=Fundidesulfovibrio putealis TaxID=270496 RepID=UPI000401A3BA|nr:flagellar basal body P-ring protein FlgI [Fundidesulfovibrio putealis]